MAIQYTDAYAESLFSFANNINTTEGGMHVNGMKTALTRTVNALSLIHIFCDRVLFFFTEFARQKK